MNRSITIARAAALAGLCSGCVVWSAASFAADDTLPQGTVALHGADFTSPSDVARLKHRVERVAANICLGDSANRSFTSRSERACYDTAMKDGLAQIAGRQEQAMRKRTVRLAGTNSGANSAQ